MCLTNRLYIKKMMFTLKLPEGSSFDDHVDQFNKVCDTLETIDEGLDDEGKTLLLVSSLLESYSNFIAIPMYRRQTISLDEVKASSNTKKLLEKSGSVKNGEGLTVKENLTRMMQKRKNRERTSLSLET